MDNFFMSLGGGNEIGASAYYVYLNGKNFLFDAGIRYMSRKRYPSLSELIKIPTIDVLNDLNGIFLSHAHYDHNGALPLLASKLTENKEIICTDYTKRFTEVQLNILRKHTGIPEYSMYEEVLVDKSLGMLSIYEVNKKFNKNGYNFTFYNAGHIPGAVMTLVEVEDSKVLYTGDFCDLDHGFTSKYELPNISDLDLLIINSTKIYQKENKNHLIWEDDMAGVKDLLKRVILFEIINIEFNQVNNGMEMALLLYNKIKNSDFNILNIKIYVDKEIKNMISIIEEKENIKYENIYLLDEKVNIPNERAIVITLSKNNRNLSYPKINLVYSLHETYNGIKDLILKLRPKKTLITHYPDKDREETLIKDLEKEGYFDAEYVINECIYDF